MTRGEHKVLQGKRKLLKQRVYLSALKLDDGELLILASSKAAETSLERYGHRWEIETLFGCLKGRGFRFEDTRITKLQRIETMMAVLTIAFAWAHKVGDWLNAEKKPIRVKKHGRLAISYFRYGLDWIRQALVGVATKPAQLDKCIEILIDSWPNLRTNIRLRVL